jgi:hypothetical protein
MCQRGNKVGIKYFKKEKTEAAWSDITRDERFFCAKLFFDLQGQKQLHKFIKFLNEQHGQNPFTDVLVVDKENPFFNNIKLNEQANWELGYEVCFYRDLLLYHDNPIREFNRNRKLSLSEKRTFDLCLFSDDQLVIIEAKVQQGLNKKQCEEFGNDKKHIQQLFESLDFECPKVSFVILASSKYYNSPSFTLKQREDGKGEGIGCKFIKVNEDLSLCFISWQQIANNFKIASSDEAEAAAKFYKHVDEVYGQ